MRTPEAAIRRRPAMAPKICGADVELGNFILGSERRAESGAEAAWMLLQEIGGLPLSSAAAPLPEGDLPAPWRSVWEEPDLAMWRASAARRGEDPTDRGRRFLATNGGCCYIDLDHLEICLPEVRSARRHVAAWHAMLRVARAAMVAAQRRLPAGERLEVLVNNSDGRGNSYGAHLDFLVSRALWEDLFHRRMHKLLFLASYQASSLVFAGQGKVGAENRRPRVDFQLSQRADFMEVLVGPQTTWRRPLVNSRDEPHCGGGGRREPGRGARLHVIFYDANLCHVASLLKVGVMQIVLAMLEAEAMDLDLVLEDPLAAVWGWSRDPALGHRARTVSGRALTAVEHQLLLCERATAFAARRPLARVVPEAGEILALWQDTLSKLRAGAWDELAPRLDWVLKRSLLERTLGDHPELGWRSPAIKHLDHLYSSLDPAHGLYWACEREGTVERVAAEREIAALVEAPPPDTRARARAELLRSLPPEAVLEVDWDRVRYEDAAGDEWVLDLGGPGRRKASRADAVRVVRPKPARARLCGLPKSYLY